LGLAWNQWNQPWLNSKMAKKTPETDFGVKKCRRKKIGISQLKPNFMKIWIQPAQPKICGKNRVEPVNLEFSENLLG